MLQDIPSPDPVDQGDEDVWETVGPTTERSMSTPPSTEEDVPEGAQQQTRAVEAQASVEEGHAPLWLQLWNSQKRLLSRP
jgi:hypothetical protein